MFGKHTLNVTARIVLAKFRILLQDTKCYADFVVVGHELFQHSFVTRHAHICMQWCSKRSFRHIAQSSDLSQASVSLVF